ncbi:MULTISPECIES: YegP family protein [Bradyrhizobium]|uniref:Uncharacterized conserved protein YegP, UPF0339 family n=1 Tax=Bradyrhizobium yuanmingense TaxID=108015 RepID=A0A1C3XII1_9BRAD|nr:MULTISPECIES: DUF1508 domain-containing protein [Bradyrhizobium]MCA1544702.1 DUF1508 domain-containing protein [Bradyrhizobium sp. NBAIM32]MDD1523394.1 DUF1508 domain-containing protein [Bradyrhizobium sp. WBAH30]MDD1547708.1 DUF1508 domain-containing protein [Bradyrhizobium sp. WBAH41]MDD1561360.1 DUF1508 domain-containing protein [Bradyrhizobium sp. WBAH23]MDD1567329.1 DUF1508 domain-containing protein [Bradyrhizobium sp. WBAH33]
MYFQIYRDTRDEWRWTLLAGNMRKIAESGEGYHNRADCLAVIELVKSTDRDTPVRG